jgi:hypothetical protein
MLDRILAFFRHFKKPRAHSHDAPSLLVGDSGAVVTPSEEVVPLSMLDVGRVLKRLRATNPELSDLDLANKIGQSVDYVRKALRAVDKS